jgi:hypothetical protein
MATDAQANQVLLRIGTSVAAKFLVVNFQIRHRAARLTPPAIATQNLLPESLICRSIESQARESWPN